MTDHLGNHISYSSNTRYTCFFIYIISYRTHIDMEIWLVSPGGRRGSVKGTTAGMMEGLLDFCKNNNPISYH